MSEDLKIQVAIETASALSNLQKLNTGLDALGTKANQANSNIEKFESKLNKTNKVKVDSSELDKLQQKLGRTLSLDKALNLSASLAGLALAGAAAYSLANAAEKINQKLRPIKFISGDENTATQNIAFLKKQADETGQSFVDLAGSYKGFAGALKGSGENFAEINTQFKQITEGAQVLGLTSEETSGTFLALEQVASKGKVSFEELNGQLAERVPGALGIAARAYGVTTQKLTAMVTKGLDGAQFVRLFSAELAKETHNGLAASSDTLTGAQNRLSNSTADLTLKLGNLATPGAITFVKALDLAIKGLNETIDNINESSISNKFDAIARNARANVITEELNKKRGLGYIIENRLEAVKQANKEFSQIAQAEGPVNQFKINGAAKNTGKTVTDEEVKYAAGQAKDNAKKIAKDALSDQREAAQESKRIAEQSLTDLKTNLEDKRRAQQDALTGARKYEDDSLSIKRQSKANLIAIDNIGATTNIGANYAASKLKSEQNTSDALLGFKRSYADQELKLIQTKEDRAYEIEKRSLDNRYRLQEQYYKQQEKLIDRDSTGSKAVTGGSISDIAASNLGRNSAIIPGTEAGNKACAAIVSDIIVASTKDISYKGIKSVIALKDKLANDPKFKSIPYGQADANDIVLGTGGRFSHTGVAIGNNKIISNSSSKKEVSQNYTESSFAAAARAGGSNLYAFRPINSNSPNSNSPNSNNSLAPLSQSNNVVYADRSSLDATDKQLREAQLLFDIKKADSEITTSKSKLNEDIAKSSLDIAKAKLIFSKDYVGLAKLESEEKEASLNYLRTERQEKDKLFNAEITNLNKKLSLTKDISEAAGIKADLRVVNSNKNIFDKSNDNKINEVTNKPLDTATKQQTFNDNLIKSQADKKAELDNNIKLLGIQRNNIGATDEQLQALVVTQNAEYEITKLLTQAKRDELPLDPIIEADIRSQASAQNEYNKQLKETNDLKGQVQELASGTSQAFGTLFRDITGGAKTLDQSLSDLFGNIANTFLATAEKMLTDALTKQLVNLFAGLLGGGDNSGGGAVPLIANANGGVVSYGTKLFANGGIANYGGGTGGITNGPIQIAGEAGPEAIVPLPNGRSIPVQFAKNNNSNRGDNSNNSGAVTINVYTTIQGSGNEKTDSKLADKATEQLRAVARDEIAQALRPGGQISNAQSRR